MSTNITDQHREAFEALTSGEHSNFALFSCFVGGEPASAIVAVNQDGDDYIITPLSSALPPQWSLPTMTARVRERQEAGHDRLE